MKISTLELRENGQWNGKVSYVDAYLKNGKWYDCKTNKVIDRILIFSRN